MSLGDDDGAPEDARPAKRAATATGRNLLRTPARGQAAAATAQATATTTTGNITVPSPAMMAAVVPVAARAATPAAVAPAPSAAIASENMAIVRTLLKRSPDALYVAFERGAITFLGTNVQALALIAIMENDGLAERFATSSMCMSTAARRASTANMLMSALQVFPADIFPRAGFWVFLERHAMRDELVQGLLLGFLCEALRTHIVRAHDLPVAHSMLAAACAYLLTGEPLAEAPVAYSGLAMSILLDEAWKRPADSYVSLAQAPTPLKVSMLDALLEAAERQLAEAPTAVAVQAL
jgi:hypothetical protein